MALAPAGYWYVIAYEAWPSAPSTIGSGWSYSWRQFAYYDGKPLQLGQPEGAVVAAQIAHDATFKPNGAQKGAIRAWWWNGSGWEPRRELDRNWGPKGLVEPEPPAPSAPLPYNPLSDYKLPDAQGNCPQGYGIAHGDGTFQPLTYCKVTSLGATVTAADILPTLLLWLVPIGIGAAILYDVAGPRKWKHS